MKEAEDERSANEAEGRSKTGGEKEEGNSQFNSRSPCLTTCSYWAFFLSRRLVSTTPLTLSIVQLSRPEEMRRERSL